MKLLSQKGMFDTHQEDCRSLTVVRYAEKNDGDYFRPCVIFMGLFHVDFKCRWKRSTIPFEIGCSVVVLIFSVPSMRVNSAHIDERIWAP
ncbi:hypothetical protein TNCV_4998961 [Trichonephila clavipes]|nr:hypothetical protein TNCV_4998961 [Trichonephila clavipes]